MRGEKKIEMSEIDVTFWVAKYADLLFNHAYVKLKDTELAKDLVQETFIAGLKSVDKFEHKSSVKTWLYSILKRKIVDHWRAEERRKTKPISYFQEGGIMNGNSLIHQQPPGILAEIELKLENDELAVVLKESLALLPEKWRIIITEKLIEDRKSEDICNDYNISPANLWVIIHRAKLQLRASLQARWYNK